jgi:ribokinase
MLSPRVAVVGSLNVDLTLAVDRLPGPGETVLSRQAGREACGGKGANQAAAAAAFGGNARMIGRVGGDEYGRKILTDLAAQGVDTSGIRVTPGERSGTATIAVDPEGENLILVDPGANGKLAPGDITGAPLAEASALLVQLEIPLPTVAAAIQAATALVVLNPAPAVPLAAGIFDHVDVLVPNVSELGLLTGGTPPDTLDGIVQVARKLADHMDVVVTLGRDGAVVVPRDGGRAAHIAPPTVEVVDTTGAGDCFCGTLAVLLAEGAGLADAATASVAAAGICTTGTGARGRLPRRDEVLRLAAGLRSQPVDA